MVQRPRPDLRGGVCSNAHSYRNRGAGRSNAPAYSALAPAPCLVLDSGLVRRSVNFDCPGPDRGRQSAHWRDADKREDVLLAPATNR